MTTERKSSPPVAVVFGRQPKDKLGKPTSRLAPTIGQHARDMHSAPKIQPPRANASLGRRQQSNRHEKNDSCTCRAQPHRTKRCGQPFLHERSRQPVQRTLPPAPITTTAYHNKSNNNENNNDNNNNINNKQHTRRPTHAHRFPEWSSRAAKTTWRSKALGERMARPMQGPREGSGSVTTAGAVNGALSYT